MSTALATSPAARPDAPNLPASDAGGNGRDGARPHLRLVTPPPSRASTWRRRVGAVLVVALLAALLVAGFGRVGASASLEDRVDGHVVIEPGQTLWDVASTTAPEGVDAREQLRAIQDLNGFDGGRVDAWSVVLLPAR